jgi:hypothetical protein
MTLSIRIFSVTMLSIKAIIKKALSLKAPSIILSEAIFQ